MPPGVVITSSGVLVDTVGVVVDDGTGDCCDDCAESTPPVCGNDSSCDDFCTDNFSSNSNGPEGCGCLCGPHKAAPLCWHYVVTYTPRSDCFNSGTGSGTKMTFTSGPVTWSGCLSRTGVDGSSKSVTLVRGPTCTETTSIELATINLPSRTPPANGSQVNTVTGLIVGIGNSGNGLAHSNPTYTGPFNACSGGTLTSNGQSSANVVTGSFVMTLTPICECQGLNCHEETGAAPLRCAHTITVTYKPQTGIIGGDPTNPSFGASVNVVCTGSAATGWSGTNGANSVSIVRSGTCQPTVGLTGATWTATFAGAYCTAIYDSGHQKCPPTSSPWTQRAGTTCFVSTLSLAYGSDCP